MPGRFIWLFLALLFTTAVSAGIEVRDDLGRRVTLSAPAKRVVTLAPHLTELVYAAGGDNQIVATVAWSDYPEAAKSLPVIGSNNRINYEALLLQKPDLVLVWHSGNNAGILEQLQALGFTVYVNDPEQLSDIPKTLTRLGVLLGQENTAEREAATFSAELAALNREFHSADRLRVFYQIWDQPLMTLGRGHLLNDVLALCGGENVFADQPVLVPRLSVESVLAAEPEVIIIAQYLATESAFARWRQWPQMRAVAADNLYAVNPYLLHRHSPRILQGARELCQKLALARGAGEKAVN